MKTIDKLTQSLADAIAANPNNKISISAIAKSSDVSPSTIHNRYTEILEQIKAHNLLIAIAGDDTSKDKLKKVKSDKASLTEENKELKKLVQQLVSLNANYEIKNAKLVNKVSVLTKENSELKKKYGSIKQL